MLAATCPNCGWPWSEPYEIASTHYTSEGVVTYTRCACGALQARLLRWGAAAAQPVAEGGLPDRPAGGAEPARFR